MRKYVRSPLVIAVIASLLCGLLAITSPLDHIYWNARFKLGGRPASGSVIIVSENPAMTNAPDSGWTSREQARLLEMLRRQMPRRVFLDVAMDASSDREGDTQFAHQIAALGRDIAVVARSTRADAENARDFALPAAALRGHAEIVVSAWATSFVGYAISSPYRVEYAGRQFRTLTAALAEKDGSAHQSCFVSPEIDPDSIPVVDARKVFSGDFAPGLMTGRTVIVSDFRRTGRTLGLAGHGRVAPVLIDVSSAEGMRKPFSLYVDFIPSLLLTALLLAAAAMRRSARERMALYSAAAAAALVVPAILQEIGIVSAPSAAFDCLFVYSGLKLWRRWRRKVEFTSRAGLPNLQAFAETAPGAGRDVIAAVIARYDEFLTTLPPTLHAECAHQIARRLAVGAGCSQIFHGEGGHFVWTEVAIPLEQQLEHLEGLRALFAAPLQVGAHVFDTNIHFGLDRNDGFDPLTRLNAALASAGEALKHGRTVQQYAAERHADASWDLSLHARIDEGLRNGEIWLAFQPQWDFRQQRIAGAEALIRWNHPLRGPIRPDAFILEAERAGRIDTLTYWVLDEAISAAQAVARFDAHFQMSVNLSAQMIDKPALVSNIADVVRRRGIDCRRLTLEITETLGIHNRPAARSNLAQLRAMGFRLSIDDFGTGEASLSYLAELPSDELKLDKCFISAIVGSERNRKIVCGAIALAHDLGQVVVAEGIEDQRTFQLLGAMGCDHGQGFWIGKPEPLIVLHELLAQANRPNPAILTGC